MKEKIEKLLDIETLDRNLFRGQGEGGEVASRVFGGHVIAQALAAAYKTVEERLCHSLHAYFIRPGDPSTPIIYEVDRARDGGSFTTRRVVAIQNGKQIFNMAASFHIFHFMLMGPALFFNMKGCSHIEYLFAILYGNHSSRCEASTIACSVNLINNRCRWISGSYKISMKRMTKPFLNGFVGRC